MGEGAKIPSGGVRADRDGLGARTLCDRNVCLIFWLGIGLLR